MLYVFILFFLRGEVGLTRELLLFRES
uniref:Uncharacterized protein n=1 Tax=Anguilla anguilla TaxID=7936 RepID=A0A0E9U880_ANGAN